MFNATTRAILLNTPTNSSDRVVNEVPETWNIEDLIEWVDYLQKTPHDRIPQPCGYTIKKLTQEYTTILNNALDQYEES